VTTSITLEIVLDVTHSSLPSIERLRLSSLRALVILTSSDFSQSAICPRPPLSAPPTHFRSSGVSPRVTTSSGRIVAEALGPPPCVRGCGSALKAAAPAFEAVEAVSICDGAPREDVGLLRLEDAAELTDIEGFAPMLWRWGQEKLIGKSWPHASGVPRRFASSSWSQWRVLANQNDQYLF
jgi:hypothetical protein